MSERVYGFLTVVGIVASFGVVGAIDASFRSRRRRREHDARRRGRYEALRWQRESRRP